MSYLVTFVVAFALGALCEHWHVLSWLASLPPLALFILGAVSVAVTFFVMIAKWFEGPMV